MQADAKFAITHLLRYVQPNKHLEWREEFRKLHEEEYRQVIQPELTVQADIIRMSQAVNMLSEKTDGRAIIVSDVGQNQMAAMRYYRFKQAKSHITSGGLGTMGFALPAAIGAKIANPDREVICIAGDGGIQMNIQELAVIKQEKLPLKILLLNNNYLGMVRQWQEMFYEERYSFVDLVNPDFIALAAAYGIKGSSVSNPADLEAGIDAMLASKEAYFLEVIVEKREKVFPMIPAGSGVAEIRLS
jgi:acetolactate synthase-1/2/3 large subunit